MKLNNFASMLASRFIKNIREHNLFHSSDLLLLAVSGGVDSVALCELCHQSGFRFQIAHVNFQLRGEESNSDEIFVRSIADKYQVPIHVRRFDTEGFSRLNKLSIQVAARELRYGWFRELLEEGAHCLLTAHHADDNIETVLMNFFRGTGISGLRGIQPKNEKIIRPLLPFTKDEIIDFAKVNHLVWREDSSNATEKYSRNYFRNAVIPMVNKIYPEVERNLTGNIRRFAEIEILYNQAIDMHKCRLMEQRGNEIHIPVLKLKKSEPLNTIVYEIIRHFHFTASQVNDVTHLLDAGQGKFVESATHRIFRNRNWLIISPNDTVEADNIVIGEKDGSVRFVNGVIEMKITGNTGLQDNSSIALLDTRMIKYPLILRKWKPGDYFYPLGMKKKKKVARFLIDRKLSPPAKKGVWVIESGKRICWIVNMRIDERFKINANTSSVLELSLKPE